MIVRLEQLGKKYFNTWIFKDLSATIEPKHKVAILGINGSGKSTLMQCISGHVATTEGQVQYYKGNEKIEERNWYKHLGFCSPSLNLIEDFTLYECLEYHFKFKQSMVSVQDTIDYIGLTSNAHKQIELFSSGMKQRVKLAQALMIQSALCFLDEPCSNLDDNGITLYQKMVRDFGDEKTIFVSSNDAAEYSFCSQQLRIEDYQ
jgi:ABC-2 type transport system ATP-binding protein